MVRILPEMQRAAWRAEIAESPTWRSSTGLRLVELGGAVAFAAALLDAAISWFVLRGSVHAERNPIAASVMRAIGLGPTLTLGALLRFGIVLVLVFIATRAVRPVVRYSATTLLGTVALWWTLVVFLNAAVVARGPILG